MTGDRASTPGVTSAHLETRLVRSHVAEIAVRGELDMRTGAHLQEALERCFDDDSIEMLSLNLGGVTFIDSSGLRLLIRARRAAKMTDRVLVLTAPTESVVRLLEVTGMDKLFNIADD